jgi:hypothetical protein
MNNHPARGLEEKNMPFSTKEQTQLKTKDASTTTPPTPQELNIYYIAYQTKKEIYGRIRETKLNLDSSEGLVQWIEDEEIIMGTKIVPIFLKKLDQ